MISDDLCTENGIRGRRGWEMPSRPESDHQPHHRSWSSRRHAPAVGEDGFTIIELLIVMILLPAIVGAVTIAIITTLKNEDSVSNRLQNSVDAQITSATFTRDVQSASSVTTGSPASPAQCDPSHQGGILLGLQWTNAVVTYADVQVGSGASAHYDLVRRFCGATTSVETIAHNLQSPINQGTATVTCGSTITTCNYPTTWMSTAGVSGVSITVLDLPPNPNAGSPTNYTFTLTAAPRNWNTTSCGTGCSGGTPLPPIFLTGSGLAPNSCVITMTASGDSVTVNNGPLVINGSGDKICNGNSGVALNVNPGPIQSYQCGASCGQVLSSYTGTCSENGGACTVLSTSTQLNLPVIPAPSSPKSTDPQQTCTMAASVTCQPGYYPNGLTIPSGDVVTFAPGNYLFGNQLQILGNLTFGTGDYTFDNGLLINHTGVVLQGNGVFFYMAGGALNLDTQNNTINLVAPATGPYAGVLYYQPMSDTSPLSLGAAGTSTVAYGGAVEAPWANVVMGSTGDTFTVGNLVAASLTLNSKSATATTG